jgi:5-methylcytosine-specific restriction protein A
MPDWKGSQRREELPPDWPATVLRILTRDHHRCQWIRNDTGRRCLKPARDVDHRTPHSEGGTDHDTNLWALCGYHHDRKSGREGGIASGKSRRATRTARRAAHPGLVECRDRMIPRRSS